MTPDDYADLGYKAFPCDGKRPARCSTWPNDVAFRQGDNVAIVVPIGAVVIDLDRKPGCDGVEGLLGVAPDGWAFAGPRARTGGGGLHLWFGASPLLGLGNGRGDLPPGVDVRGGGMGYVIVAPSVHPDTGRAYQWSTPLVPVAELPPLPDWLLTHLLAHAPEPQRASLAASFPGDRPDMTPYIQAALEAEAAKVREAPDGAGNDAINRAAFKLGTLQAHGLEHAEAAMAIDEATAGWTWRRPGDAAAARRTFDSGWRAGEVVPRAIPDGRARQKAYPSTRVENGALSSQSKLHTSTYTRSHAPGSDGNREDTRNDPCDPSPRERAPSPSQAEKPEIRITTDEPAVNDAAIAALAGAGYQDIYQRAGELVRVVRYADTPGRLDDVAPAQPVINPLRRATLQERLAGSATWQRYDARAKDWLPTHPPGWAVQAVHERAHWQGIPTIRGIADYPLIRADGSCATKAGYDVGTGFYIGAIPKGLEVPDKPTRDDARAAADRLLDLVCDFPLCDDTDRAAWLSYLLTPLARAITDGPTPLFIASATVRGTGKTLLFSVPGWILTGRDLPAQSYGKDDAELEKILVAVALLGLPLLVFDNVKTTIGGAVLDKWLTSTTPTGRILGKSEVALFDWTTVLAATSNNAAVAGDTDRRAIYVKQQTDHERPELRRGFEHPDLRAHVRAHRGALLSDALTILRAYQLVGSPAQTGRPKGSFERWARAVRDPLLWLGLADAERTADDPARPVDAETEVLGPLLNALEEAFAGAEFSVGEIIDHAWPSSGREPYESEARLRDALALLAYRGDRPSRVAIGKRLQRYRGRWLGDMSLDSSINASTNALSWRIVIRNAQHNPAGDPGIAGDRTTPDAGTVRQLNTIGLGNPREPPDPRQYDKKGQDVLF